MPRDALILTVPDETQIVSLCFESGEIAVRDTLACVTETLCAAGLSQDDIGSVQIVLGEVLNNVVEHAYGPLEQGYIGLRCAQLGPALRFEVCDHGKGLPTGRLPEARLPALSGPLDSLPEGGFGWYLVQNLACDISYRRTQGLNTLAFSILCGADG